MEVFKTFAIIMVCAVLCIIFKSYKAEYSLFIGIACSVMVLTIIISKILVPLSLIEQKIEQSGIDNNYFKVALKALGIGYITSFVSQSCKDAGLQALSLKAELVGKSAIFLLSVPLVLSILETAIGFVK